MRSGKPDLPVQWKKYIPFAKIIIHFWTTRLVLISIVISRMVPQTARSPFISIQDLFSTITSGNLQPDRGDTRESSPWKLIKVKLNEEYILCQEANPCKYHCVAITGLTSTGIPGFREEKYEIKNYGGREDKHKYIPVNLPFLQVIKKELDDISLSFKIDWWLGKFLKVKFPMVIVSIV